ncbi:ABC transporter permease [Balneolales bacterium ANBcel1]|nr:ABC transporter permease [Balneolales bacterium ANBcel1]
MNLLPDLFSMKTAWRDARAQYRSLLLYCGGIVAGVAALVAILSFRSDVMLTVNDQAKELLGADMEISRTEPFGDRLQEMVDSVGGSQAHALSFSSMVLYRPGESRGAESTRLSQIRAIEGQFPFYGEMKTEPPDAAARYQAERSALVDRPAMNQFGLQVGDSIRVGNEWMPISGVLLEFPGESAVFSLIGPRVVVPRSVVAGTELLDRGSRVQYTTWFAFDDGREDLQSEAELEHLASAFREREPESMLTVTTVASRKNDFAMVIDNLVRFLGMVGFIALMLGALGVASAIYVYIKRKSATVATLRCLGASSRQTLQIFGIQVAGIGLAGSLIGVGLGMVAQRFLPMLFTDFLPFELMQQVSLSAVALGFVTGVAVSFVLSLLPLLSINNIPPLLTIRATDFSPLAHVGKRTKAAVSAGIIVTLTTILGLLLESFVAAAVFVIGLVVAMALLLGTSTLFVHLARMLRLRSFSYIWRQGIANMFRPNNQTSVLVTTLGMGMLLIGSMYLSQEMILQRIELQTGGDGQPNLVFYDIQQDQIEDIVSIAEQNGVDVIENVPIVSMRLTHLNGRPVREIREDTTRQQSSWALTREYRVTYRESLNEAETLLEGEWIGRSAGIGSGEIVPVSMDYRLADDLSSGLGDTLRFDVQGVPVDTYIASIRDVDFQRPQPNFFLLFPAGVLEPAPQFHAMTLRAPDEAATHRMQQEVVRSHPNVSAIDIGLVLESVQTFLGKIAMAVQFMALFTILTGLIVLASAIAISRFQRIRESVLLRTLGASRYQIRGIQFVEYFWLGALACLAGLLLAFAAGWLLAWFYFDLAFVPDLLALVVASAVVIALTLFVGFLNMRGMLGNSPLETLRSNLEQ